MVNLWHHKNPHSWYVRLKAHSVSFGVCRGYRPDDTPGDTHNPPDVVNEMSGVDRVQPHSDPIRRREILGCLVFRIVSVRTEAVIDVNERQ